MCFQCAASTYYVKPAGSGTKDGSSYDNAWSGLSNALGMTIGDTLYVCGTFTATNSDAHISNGVTVRMDYPEDTGYVSAGRFWMAEGASNITFQSCNFIGDGKFVAYTNNVYITWDGCNFTNNSTVELYYGKDFWTFKNCEFGNAKYGIYVLEQAEYPYSANHLTVSNCYFHDMDSAEYPHGDGHAIGIQSSSFNTIVNNRIERTAEAISFFTGDKPMSNNVVAYNFIHDIHRSSSSASGIVVSGDNVDSVEGTRPGFRIYGNIIYNTLDYGISSNNKDSMDVFNNTISNNMIGIRLYVVGGKLQGNFRNNLISLWTNTFAVSFSGSSLTDTNLNVDYNLYYPISNANQILVWSISHDTHSVTNSPQFISASPLSALDFRLNQSSPAINAGVNVGLPFCQSAPDIGAIEFCNQMLLNTINARNIRISP